MTVESTKLMVTHVTDGIKANYPFDFYVQAATDMKIYFDGVLDAGATFTIAPEDLQNKDGGDVVLDSVPVAGLNITLRREESLTQNTAYPRKNPFPSATHEAALDKLTRITQQLEEALLRAITAPVDADLGTDFTLPTYDAGKGLMWDPSTQRLKNSISNFDTIVAECQAEKAAAQQAVTDATAQYVLCQAEVTAAALQASFASTSRIAADAAKDDAENARDVVLAFPSTVNEWLAPQRYALNEYASVGATITLDPTTEPSVVLNLTQNITITLGTFGNHDVSIQIDMINDSGGPYTITWAGTAASGDCTWPDGSEETVGPGSNRLKSFFFRRVKGKQRGSIIWEGPQY